MSLPLSVRRSWVEPNPEYSIRRQCRLAGLSRSHFYYTPAPLSQEHLRLMRLIDEQFMQTPFYGSRQMARHLRRQGYRVARSRIKRLMRRMGLRARDRLSGT